MFYVHIETTNDAKTHAIRSVFEACRASLLKALGANLSDTAGRIEYIEYAVASGVGQNPRDFDETILGALNRATGALLSATPETKGIAVGVGISKAASFSFHVRGTPFSILTFAASRVVN